MKVYKNQNRNTAFDLGLRANFDFASDEIMSPNGIDITLSKGLGGKYTYEITKYNKETKTATISIMSEDEYKKWNHD